MVTQNNNKKIFTYEPNDVFHTNFIKYNDFDTPVIAQFIKIDIQEPGKSDTMRVSVYKYIDPATHP